MRADTIQVQVDADELLAILVSRSPAVAAFVNDSPGNVTVDKVEYFDTVGSARLTLYGEEA